MSKEDNRLGKLEARVSDCSSRTACKSTNALQLEKVYETEADNSLLWDVPSDESDYSISRRDVTSKQGTLQNNPKVPESTSQLLIKQIEFTKQQIFESQDLIMKKEMNNLDLKIKIAQLQDFEQAEKQLCSFCSCLIM